MSCVFRISFFILFTILYSQIFFGSSQYSLLFGDLTRFQNNPLYVIEGKGALSIFLKNNVESVYQKWGRPIHRSFSGTERLFYNHSEFRGFFQVTGGFIEKIHILIETEQNTSYYPLTEGGFHSELLQETDTLEIAKNKILQLYDKPKYYNLQDKLIIYSYGITYGFSLGKLKYIEIFKPYRPFDSR